MLLYKACTGIEIKSDVDRGVIEGYASVFGNIDSHGDIVMPSAFNKSLSDWNSAKQENRRIKVLYQHDSYEPIGIPTEMIVDSKGLYTYSKISRTPVGEKTLILARDGVLNEMSIGYYPIVEKPDAERKVNQIIELKLMEYSMVLWGSNELTSIDNVKHMMKDYAYSKGNVLDIFVDAILEKINALKLIQEPSKGTRVEMESQLLDKEVDELILEIKKMRKG